MPFNWSQQGALGGTVPNQMPGFTPKNTEGLMMPNNQVMFNLPRFQMPGTQANFAGNFGPQGAGAGWAQPTSVNFSISRTASSDPVQNIINDIGNPLGGMTANFGQGGPQQPQQQSLREQMMGQSLGKNSYGPNGFTGQKPTSALTDLGFAPQLPNDIGFDSRLPGWQGYGGGTPAQLGYPQEAPFGLRTRMLSQPPMPPLSSVFI